MTTNGIHGYSSPNEPGVIFCLDKDNLLAPFEFLRIMGDMGAKPIIGEGCYKNEVEVAYYLDQKVFDAAWPHIRHLMQNQESVLILGRMQSMNWRKASLLYLDTGKIEKIGTWLSVGDVRGLSGWSKFNGHYFAVKNNPPTCKEEEIERSHTQIVADLASALLEASPRGFIMRSHGDAYHNAMMFLRNRTLPDGRVYPANYGA